MQVPAARSVGCAAGGFSWRRCRWILRWPQCAPAASKRPRAAGSPFHRTFIPSNRVVAIHPESKPAALLRNHRSFGRSGALSERTVLVSRTGQPTAGRHEKPSGLKVCDCTGQASLLMGSGREMATQTVLRRTSRYLMASIHRAVSSARPPVGSGTGCVRPEHPSGELPAGRHAKLSEDLAQVIVNGAHADEQPCRDLGVGGSAS